MGCTCGNIIRLAESGDEKAASELGRQIRNTRNPTEKALLKVQRASLQGEMKTVKVFKKSVEGARRAVVSELKSMSTSGQVPQLSRDAVTRLIRTNGLDSALLDTVESGVSNMLPPVYEGIEIGLSAGNIEDMISLQVDAIDYTETQYLVSDTLGSLFEDQVLPKFQGTINSQLSTSEVIADADRTIADIDLQLSQNVSTLTTEARTQTAALSRMATQVSADLAGLTYQLYSGVVDGLTRPFCREIVGYAFKNKQIADLDNYQGLPVAIYGGGYNCRHGWAPISEAMIERLDKPIATMSTVGNANRAAKKSS